MGNFNYFFLPANIFWKLESIVIIAFEREKKWTKFIQEIFKEIMVSFVWVERHNTVKVLFYF